jgi:hypothetical protein
MLGSLLGMVDPKTNPKFPLNVRKNCREAEPKWIEKMQEIKQHLGTQYYPSTIHIHMHQLCCQ